MSADAAPTLWESAAEIAARTAVMLEHAYHHGERLQKSRKAMADEYRLRLARLGTEFAQVNGNDLRRWLERNPQVEAGVKSHNWRAAVFASREWEWTGQMVESTAKGGHRTKIQCYRLRRA